MVSNLMVVLTSDRAATPVINGNTLPIINILLWPKKKTICPQDRFEKLAALEKWAADDFRSVNGQLEYIITEALRKSKRLKMGKHK